MTESDRTVGSNDSSGPDGAKPSSDLTDAMATLTEEDIEPSVRRHALWQIVRAQVRGRRLRAMLRPSAAVRWVTETAIEIAPHIQIRDHATLQAHYGGLSGPVLAERLIRNSARTTGAIGAAGGGIAAVEWVTTPALLSAPVLLAAETVAVLAVELKLIAELHEVYGQPVTGTGQQRGVALLHAWAYRRGINPLVPGRGLASALGTAARKELRERLTRRLGRNLSTLGPLLTGAAVAGYLNRRATQALGAEINRDLGKPRVIEAGPG